MFRTNFCVFKYKVGPFLNVEFGGGDYEIVISKFLQIWVKHQIRRLTARAPRV